MICIFNIFHISEKEYQCSRRTLPPVSLSISLAIGATVLLWVSARVNTHILDTVMFGSILTVDDTDINVLLITTIVAGAVAIPVCLAPSVVHD